MLNHSEFLRSSWKRSVTSMPQGTEREPCIEPHETLTALLRSGMTSEATTLVLLVELDRIGRIVREIERELSLWDASEARGDSRAN
ncbi:hypothetical protein IYY11_02400 [Methylocystis sp. H62]|uniref:hypothetical protein n=1 Tax=Methylocystis sp. H62 TaxID=2785789 RepID=UPI0018C2F2D1|nr:hypothetical protein [Methylocystis sp. H62]MBG0792315.1 hypothetical protein [Methylocystis sp. H62]